MAPVGRLGWGLTGLGNHADKWIAPAIRQSQTGRLAAVFSRDAQRGQAFAEKHGHPAVYESMTDLLQDPNVDAVFLCSPNHVHEEQALLCVAAGKHVLCEKPLAPTVDACVRMVDACRTADVKLGVGFHLRHNPTHERLRELLVEGRIGDLKFAEVHYLHVTAGPEGQRIPPSWRRDPTMAGGGRFLGTGLHAVDLVRYVCGQEIAELSALADAGWAVSGYEQLVTVNARLQTDQLATIVAGPMPFPLNQILLYGGSGTVRAVDSIGNRGGGRIEIATSNGTETISFDSSDVYAAEVDAFANSIKLGTSPNASGDDGLHVAQVTAAVYESLRTNRTVSL